MKSETRSFYEAAVARAVERVTRSLDQALDIGMLAREAALSTFHFQRVFRGLVGETALELQRRLRLERAAERLCSTRTPVTALAFESGYDTHEAFTRAFGQRYGVSPSLFREQGAAAANACHGGPPTELAARCGLHFRLDRVDLGALILTKGAIPMDVTIDTFPVRRLATVRHIGPYPQIAEAFHRLGTLAAEHGLYPHVDPRMLALYHDDPETTPPAELRSDAALVLRDGTKLPAGLAEMTLPAGRYAKTSHRGAYTGLGDAWARFMGEWLPRSGFRVGAGPSYELYVNDPRTTATEHLLTELYVPVVDT